MNKIMMILVVIAGFFASSAIAQQCSVQTDPNTGRLTYFGACPANLGVPTPMVPHQSGVVYGQPPVQYIGQPAPIYGGQVRYVQVQPPQYGQYGQPVMVQRRVVQEPCSGADRVATGAVDGVIGALIGAGIARATGHSGRRGAIAGGAAGALYGGTIGCNPNMVNDTPVAVAPTQVVAVERVASRVSSETYDAPRRHGACNIKFADGESLRIPMSPTQCRKLLDSKSTSTRYSNDTCHVKFEDGEIDSYQNISESACTRLRRG